MLGLQAARLCRALGSSGESPTELPGVLLRDRPFDAPRVGVFAAPAFAMDDDLPGLPRRATAKPCGLSIISCPYAAHTCRRQPAFAKRGANLLAFRRVGLRRPVGM